MDEMIIDKNKIREEWIAKNLFDLQKDLTRQRRIRYFVMSVLLASLLLTVFYGTLENPIQYTFSNIGNFFDYRWLFIVWAIVCGVAIQCSLQALFRLEEYRSKAQYWYSGIGTIFLVATALIPALREEFPVWHYLHMGTSVIYAVLMFLSLNPFVTWVSRENPRLRLACRIWLGVIWIGSTLPLLFLGKNGLFEMWFFTSMILFLLYLSLILFEEKIVKMSVAFLKDEPNLNLAIEKIFINLEKEPKEKPSRTPS